MPRGAGPYGYFEGRSVEKEQQGKSLEETRTSSEVAGWTVMESGSTWADSSVRTLLLTLLALGWVLFVNVVFYVQLWKDYGPEVMGLLRRLFGG